MTSVVVVRNKMAVVGWVFSGLWIAGLIVFTYLYVREGGMNQMDPLLEAGVMLAFWMVGLALVGHTTAHCMIKLTVRQGGATVIRQWLWKRHESQLSARTLRGMVIRHEKDSDGDPYHKLVVSLSKDDELVISESHDVATVESARDRILARL